MEIGASFCQVDRIRQDAHEIEAITEGYQKWQGALPSFNRVAMIKMYGVTEDMGKLGIHKATLDISKIADPMA